MTRFLILLIATVSSVANVLAQACMPDNTITEPGLYPDQLDTAIADEPYEAVIQILAIRDTSVTIGGMLINATIDSVVVNSVENLPTGFEYVCEPISCTFTPDAVGCVKLTGNPTNSQAGEYPLTIKTTAYGKVGILEVPNDQEITSYTIVIQGDGTTHVDKTLLSPITVYPNPSLSGVFFLKEAVNKGAILVKNTAGKMLNPSIAVGSNTTTINLSSYPRGIYFLTIKKSDGSTTLKLVY